MTFLLLGDHHYKKTNRAATDAFERYVHQLIDKYNPTAVINMGDTLDTHERGSVRPTVRATEFVKSLGDRKPTIMLIGNHDRPDNTDFQSIYHFFRGLVKYPGVFVIDHAQRFCIDGLPIMCVPYVYPGRFDEAIASAEPSIRPVVNIDSSKGTKDMVYASPSRALRPKTPAAEDKPKRGRKTVAPKKVRGRTKGEKREEKGAEKSDEKGEKKGNVEGEEPKEETKGDEKNGKKAKIREGELPKAEDGPHYQAAEKALQGVALVLAHQEIQGAKMGSKASTVGDPWPLVRPMLYCGHIHEYDDLQINMCYTGAPLAHAFGDSRKHSVSLVTFVEKDGQWIQQEHQRIPLVIQRKKTISVIVSELKDLRMPKQGNALLPPLVKVVIHHTVAELKGLSVNPYVKKLIDDKVIIQLKALEVEKVVRGGYSIGPAGQTFQEQLMGRLTDVQQQVMRSLLDKLKSSEEQ